VRVVVTVEDALRKMPATFIPTDEVVDVIGGLRDDGYGDLLDKTVSDIYATEWDLLAYSVDVEPDVLQTALLAIARKLVDQKNAELLAGRPPRSIETVAFSEIEFHRVEWLSPYRIPLGEVTLLVGDGGYGKSIYTANLGSRVSRGWERGELYGEPASVLYISGEDDAARAIGPRLAAAGADLALAHSLSVTFDRYEDYLSFPEDLGELQAAIEKTEARLVVIDPLVVFLGDAVDAHVDKSVRRALGPLRSVAEATHSAILCVHHINKARSGSMSIRVSGSIGFRNQARSVLLWTKPAKEAGERDNLRYLVHDKSNYGPLQFALVYELTTKDVDGTDGPIQAGAIVYRDQIDLTSAEALDPKSADDRLAEEAAYEFLCETLGSGPGRYRDLLDEAKAYKISEITLRRARNRLRDEGRLSYDEKSHEWTLIEPCSSHPKTASDEQGQHVNGYKAKTLESGDLAHHSLYRQDHEHGTPPDDGEAAWQI
jgi:hypothetical protein